MLAGIILWAYVQSQLTLLLIRLIICSSTTTARNIPCTRKDIPISITPSDFWFAVKFVAKVTCCNLELDRTSPTEKHKSVFCVCKDVGYFPFNPTRMWHKVRVGVAARTHLLATFNENSVAQHDTHFENHSRFHRAGKFRRTNSSAIFSTD